MLNHLKAPTLTLLVFGCGLLLGNAQFFSDFESGLPAGAAVAGTAKIEGGVLKLTEALASQQGSFILPELLPGQPVTRFTATFKARIGGSTTPARPADGFSFCFGSLTDGSSFGEDGTGGSIIVSFDTWDNAGTDTAPAIDLNVNGTIIASQAMDGVREGGRAPSGPFVTDPATGAPMTLRTEDAYATVRINLDPDGTLDLVYKGVTIFNNIQTGYVPRTGRFGLGARTGGANDNHWIDDLRVDVYTAGPVFFVSEPADATRLEGRSVTFRASVDGTPPYTLQWLRNGDVIAGATDSSYTIAAVQNSDNGAVFSLRAQNAEATVTSRGAALTVIDDNAAPVPVRAVGSATLNKITIQFDEELEPQNAVDLFNYGVSGGLTPTAANLVGDRSVILTVEPAQTENTVYTVTITGVTDLAGNAIGSASIDFRSFLVGCGGLLFEAYGGQSTGNNNLDQTLLVDPNFPNNPRERLQMPVFDTRSVYPDNGREGYGGRVRGLFIPPVSGDWVFYLASDDSSRLFLNPNGPSAAGKVLIAEEPGCCGAWTAHTSLMTPGYGRPIPLVAGQGYFIEALYKEGTGGDYLKVAARLTSEPPPPDNPNQQIPVSENAIPGSMLGFPAAPAGIAGTVTIVQQPSGQTVEENRRATFSVMATNPNDLPVCYQWRSNGVDVAGATGPSHTTPPAQLSDEGAVYSVLVSIIGDRTLSSDAVLHVREDVTPPLVESVKGTVNYQTIQIRFNEAIEPVGAVDAFNYQVTDSTGTIINVSGIRVLPDGATIELLVGQRQIPGAAYTVKVDGITDLKGNQMVGVERIFNTLSLFPGFALRELYFGFGGVTITDLRNNPVYPLSPGLTDYSPLLEGPLDRYDNYGERISGYFVPPVSGNYNFYMSSDDGGEFWLSTDANPANMVRVASEPQWNAYRDWTGTDRRNGAAPENRSTTLFPPGIPLVAGQFYYFEALMKEGGGGDNVGVAVQFPGAPAPVPGSQSLSGAFIAAPADPAGASVTITQHPQDTSVTECRTATLTVAAQGSVIGNPNHPLSYRWQRDAGSGFQDMLDAPNAPTLTVFARSADNGAKYRVILYVPGAEVTSAVATLTVLEDTEAPRLVSAARGCLDTTRITVQFNEPMDAASIGNLLNYSVEGVALASVTVVDSRTVALIAATAIPDSFCGKITINNVTDCGGVAIAANTSTELGIEKPRSEINGLLVIEAENYDAISPGTGSSPERWLLRTDKAGFSGAGAMQSFPDDGGTSPSPTQLGQSARMRYCVNFTSAGTKYMWIRGAAGPGGGSSDSLHIGTNGAHRAAITGWGAPFSWARAIQGGLGGNTFVVAAPGPYIIDVWMREDGTYIDKLLFRSDASATAPAGLGPDETPRPGPYDPPLVAITSPADGSIVESCSTVTVTANASIACGSIVSVEFFANNQLLGADNSAPYELTVPNALPGNYVLTAKATDNHGLSTTSPGVNVTVQFVNKAPSFTLTGNVAADEDAGAASVAGFAAGVNKGSVCENGQVLTFEITANDNPGLFLAQPAIDSAGTLTFQSAPEACGVANLAVVLKDDGGAENGGHDTSAPAAFQLRINPVNDCPVAAGQDVRCQEDGSAAITLTGVDMDAASSCGQAGLGFRLTGSPAHGRLTGTPPNLVYTPEPEYCGPDRFTFAVSDGLCEAGAAVNITVECVNDPPTNCVAQIGPTECDLMFEHQARHFAICLNLRDVCLTLSGTAGDPEGDPLTFAWLDNGQAVASGAMATNCFPLGCHTVTMVASDPGGSSCTSQFELCVITAREAVEQCIELVETTQVERRNKRPLIVSLKAAKAAFEREGWGAGVNILNAFKHKVEAQIARNNPAEAQMFIRSADNVIKAVECVVTKAPRNDNDNN